MLLFCNCDQEVNVKATAVNVVNDRSPEFVENYFRKRTQL